MSSPHPGDVRARATQLQRERRAQLRRVDYTPSPHAWAVIEARRTQERPGTVAATNSAVIDAIVTEWGVMHGHSLPSSPELSRPSQARAGVFESGGSAKNCRQVRPRTYESDAKPGNEAAQRAGTYDSDTAVADAERAAHTRMTSNKAQLRLGQRVVCGAKRHRDGQPCEARSEPGKPRCRFHGGRSTGPRTLAGRQRALANLRQNRRRENVPA